MYSKIPLQQYLYNNNLIARKNNIIQQEESMINQIKTNRINKTKKKKPEYFPIQTDKAKTDGHTIYLVTDLEEDSNNYIKSHINKDKIIYVKGELRKEVNNKNFKSQRTFDNEIDKIKKVNYFKNKKTNDNLDIKNNSLNKENIIKYIDKNNKISINSFNCPITKRIREGAKLLSKERKKNLTLKKIMNTNNNTNNSIFNKTFDTLEINNQIFNKLNKLKRRRTNSNYNIINDSSLLSSFNITKENNNNTIKHSISKNFSFYELKRSYDKILKGNFSFNSFKNKILEDFDDKDIFDKNFLEELKNSQKKILLSNSLKKYNRFKSHEKLGRKDNLNYNNINCAPFRDEILIQINENEKNGIKNNDKVNFEDYNNYDKFTFGSKVEVKNIEEDDIVTNNINNIDEENNNISFFKEKYLEDKNNNINDNNFKEEKKIRIKDIILDQNLDNQKSTISYDINENNDDNIIYKDNKDMKIYYDDEKNKKKLGTHPYYFVKKLVREEHYYVDEYGKERLFKVKQKFINNKKKNINTIPFNNKRKKSKEDINEKNKNSINYDSKVNLIKINKMPNFQKYNQNLNNKYDEKTHKLKKISRKITHDLLLNKSLTSQQDDVSNLNNYLFSNKISNINKRNQNKNIYNNFQNSKLSKTNSSFNNENKSINSKNSLIKDSRNNNNFLNCQTLNNTSIKRNNILERVSYTESNKNNNNKNTNISYIKVNKIKSNKKLNPDKNIKNRIYTNLNQSKNHIFHEIKSIKNFEKLLYNSNSLYMSHEKPIDDLNISNHSNRYSTYSTRSGQNYENKLFQNNRNLINDRNYAKLTKNKQNNFALKSKSTGLFISSRFSNKYHDNNVSSKERNNYRYYESKSTKKNLEINNTFGKNNSYTNKGGLTSRNLNINNKRNRYFYSNWN